MSRRYRLGYAFALALVFVMACGAPDLARKPVYRFVDPRPRVSPHVPVAPEEIGTSRWPLGSIGDDARPVLAAPAHDLILSVKDVEVPSDGRIRLRRRLPPGLARARWAVLTPQFRLGPSWTRLPPQVVDVVRKGEGGAISIDLMLPEETRGESVVLHSLAYAVDLVDLGLVETAAVEIPAEATLEFATGILPPAWDQGAVDFELHVCEGAACEVLFEERLDPANEAHRSWQAKRLPLAHLKGRKRSFRFEARPVNEGSFSFPLWANPVLYSPVPRRAEDLNLILLSIDTLRADHLNTYGYDRDTAPFIDAVLASGGTTFETCVAAATTTTPSHMTIFTSLHPIAHGSRTGMEKLPATIVTLPEIVRAAGIDTVAFTENGWLGIHQGFGRGFDRYQENKGDSVEVVEGHIERTFSQATAWLEANADKRFFMFLHTYQVHDPYTPPPDYAHLFMDEPRAEERAEAEAILNYDREIRYTDDRLRDLWKVLERLRLDERTVFILTADHGEEFLEHGMILHGANLYEESIHVPLLVRGPGIPAGRRVGVPVGHQDLLPTVLDLLGVRAPLRGEAESLMPLLAAGATGGPTSRRPVFSESVAPLAWGPGKQILPWKPPAYAVRRGAWKLVRFRTADGHRHELYNLETDPGELEDLFASKRSEVRDLVDLLEDYSKTERAEGNVVAQSESDRPLDPQQEERLRALGYIE